MGKEEFINILKKTIQVLENGGLFLYPSDTIWGIGCDATNAEAVQKVLALKRMDSKGLISLVANDAMLERHVEKVPDLAYDILDLATKPTTLVYDRPKGFANNLLAKDNSVAIRVASDKFCKNLIGKFKKPIVSTSANLQGQRIALNFKEIDKAILTGVDYVVNLEPENQYAGPSSIIKLGLDGRVAVIRE